jgi:flavin reductase (DIM6/NTAB) family NADH-FMN oxidoreductase RutF
MAKLEIPLNKALRLLQSGVVALVTARHKDVQNVMTAQWLTPVSSDPPLVVLAIHPARFTHDLIRKSGQFALNIPARPLLEKIIRAGKTSGADGDKFLALGLEIYAAKQIAAPLIAECIAHVECGVIETFPVGDHILFAGEIVAASAEESAFNGETWTLADESVKPVHHLGAGVYAILQEAIRG